MCFIFIIDYFYSWVIYFMVCYCSWNKPLYCFYVSLVFFVLIICTVDKDWLISNLIGFVKARMIWNSSWFLFVVFFVWYILLNLIMFVYALFRSPPNIFAFIITEGWFALLFPCLVLCLLLLFLLWMFYFLFYLSLISPTPASTRFDTSIAVPFQCCIASALYILYPLM